MNDKKKEAKTKLSDLAVFVIGQKGKMFEGILADYSKDEVIKVCCPPVKHTLINDEKINNAYKNNWQAQLKENEKGDAPISEVLAIQEQARRRAVAQAQLDHDKEHGG